MINYKKLPKIELHCHLDGSMKVETMAKLGKNLKVDMPSYNPKKLAKMFLDMSSKKEKAHYVEKMHKQKFQMTIDIISNKKNMILAIHELLKTAADENVKYQEIRFAPRLHITKNFKLEEILKSFSLGLISGMKKYDIIANGIICFRSSYDKSDVKEVLLAASKYLDKRIVGVDLVGIEVEGFAHKFIEEIKYAQNLGFKTTIHAGEMLESSQNVAQAITLLNTKRIGHGFKMHNDKKQVDLILKNKTHIEICLSSNQKRIKNRDLTHHPFKKYLDLGVSLSLNTDNRTLSNTNMTKEIQKAFNHCGLSMKKYKKIYLDSIDAAFASKSEKEKLRKYI